ncbi:hypothetical protein EYF80_013613 [Liparis tanakae]|uniref:Uncharacterized protein n=1 Tax=Liparis tanakae TaxID=230148 RepID=A0A4Z2IFK8_9TELE|nr:hypothetical protein EYF80_013613 [Liparis tanakae]
MVIAAGRTPRAAGGGAKALHSGRHAEGRRSNNVVSLWSEALSSATGQTSLVSAALPIGAGQDHENHFQFLSRFHELEFHTAMAYPLISV